MKLYTVYFALLWTVCHPIFAQTNMVLTHPAAFEVLKGNYNPSDYSASTVIADPIIIANELSDRISPAVLQTTIRQLASFGTRNAGSDTISDNRGIGAARRWVVQQFDQYSSENESRLLAGYFQFDQDICGVGRHSNMVAILPGSDPAHNGVVLVEGHIDSRCDVLCDTSCLAEGVEDNATGTALVMELARTMAKYTFKNTLVFMVTTGEEQGLVGAEAFALFAKNNNIPLRAVMNNDVIGGVLCGHTSSVPSCPGLDNVDSTSVRLFSYGSVYSLNKQLARFIKLEYNENLKSTQAVPMNVRIMSPEDRTGRGGDHIPFREQNFTAMRFTSANEHGDAGVGPGYLDRQHTSDDVLGVDTDGNGVIDSFFVDFNYLARNALINGNAAAMAALAVPTPVGFTATRTSGVLTVTLDDPANTGTYRIAFRSLYNDWDSLFTLTGSLTGMFPCPATGPLFVSVAAVDADGVESLFTNEKLATNVTGAFEPITEITEKNITLFQNHPNPFDEATWITFFVREKPRYRQAKVVISDLTGKIIEKIPVSIAEGMNEVLYTHGYGATGAFTYALWLDETIVDARQMVFAN